MLVQLTDHKGKEIWINPIYVKSLRAKAPELTYIEMSGSPMPLRVPQPAADLALTISAHMPAVPPAVTAALESERHAAEQSSE